MPRYEPAVYIAFLAAVAQAALLYFSDALPPWAVLVLTVLAGVATRALVIPTAKVKDAGLSPKEIDARAENPTIRPHP